MSSGTTTKAGASELGDTIMFAFWGRRANVELQLPFIRRILAENPGVKFHGWDLCRDPADSKYLRTIEGDRITVETAFSQLPPSRGQVRVWQHYTSAHYRDCTFVKLDDDDVFLEAGSFKAFVRAAQRHPSSVISALTINNGGSTRHIPELWEMFRSLDIPLLDVHLSAEYAEQCHRWFHQNWETLTGQPTKLVAADTWVSINCIAYTWSMGRDITRLLGTRSPDTIADRTFPRRNANGRMSGHKVGDEGAVNMFPILIHKGFVCGHLNFGPQVKSDQHPDGMPSELLTELRKLYADIGQQYLGQ